MSEEEKYPGIITIADDFAGYPLNSFNFSSRYKEFSERILVPHGLIEDRVKKIAGDIGRGYNGEHFYAIVILKGGFKFCGDLVKEWENLNSVGDTIVDFQVEYMRAKSYSDDKSTGKVSLSGTIVEDFGKFSGEHVLIIDEILDSGRTMKRVLEEFRRWEVRSLKSVCLVKKRLEGGCCEFTDIDYLGFEIPNSFVIGYGMDYNEQFRHLTHLCVLNENGKKAFMKAK